MPAARKTTAVLKIRPVGSSDGVILPKELLDRHQLNVGDTLAVRVSGDGYGFARNHCFPDGNKGIALAAMDVFPMLNERDLIADEAETVVVIRDLAAGAMSQEALAQWLTVNSAPLPDGEL